MSLGDVRIMMFNERPENVNLTPSRKFITITVLNDSFNVPPGSKNNWVYSISHKFRRHVPATS